MTAITREYLDALAERSALALNNPNGQMYDAAVLLASDLPAAVAALRHVLDLRDDYANVPHTVHMVRGLDAALAGTQTDDGAGGSTPAVSSGGETPPGEQSPAPAPSSPDPRHAIVHDLLYDYWEALHDDSLDHATREVIAALDAYLAEEPTHVPCCSAHGESMTCEKYRRTHFVEVRPCCSVDAERLAGTQTDDGAVSTVAAEGVALGTAEPAPAPSSPDRIEAVAQAFYGGITDPLDMATRAVAALDAYDREHPPAALRDALAEVERLTPACSCTPYHAGGDGPEEDCPVHGATETAWGEIQRLRDEVERLRSKHLRWDIFAVRDHDSYARPFVLMRDTDVSGVSGTGVVADGCASPDGTVTLRWRGGNPTSVVFHDNGIESVEAIHGHGGNTRIVWLAEDLETTAEVAAVYDERDALAAENARLRAQVETLRHHFNHPYGGIDGCARCAPTTTTTED